ncbi:hypothetical protein ACFVS2_20820 [Brevibacillus sp. NPDC058079]|uniref:hypothetical protein n=1 Tax=Brevibacillus sp. NPDC058079 TaxID=3346330 RepID=UPI0036ED958B
MSPESNSKKIYGLDKLYIFVLIMVLISLISIIIRMFDEENKADYLRTKYKGDLIQVTENLQVENGDSNPKKINYQFRGSKDSPLFGQNHKYVLRYEKLFFGAFFLGTKVEIERIKCLQNEFEIVTGKNAGKKLNPNALPNEYLGVLDFTERTGSFTLTIPNAHVEEYITNRLSNDLEWYEQVKYIENNN